MREDGYRLSGDTRAGDICGMIRALMTRYELNDNAIIRYIDLVSEIGELGKALLSNSEYSHERIENMGLVNNELGDCLFSLLSLMGAMDLDLVATLNGAIDKYEARYQQRGSIGSDYAH